MTISSPTRKAGPYTGNDVASSFAFSFKVFTTADIRVVETLISTGVETDLVLDGANGYTVSLNGDQDANPGGSITYKQSSATTPLPSTKLLTIVGALAYTQETDITNGGGFYPQVIEDRFDYITGLIQQNKEEIDRAVKVDVSSSTDPADLIDSLEADALAAAASAAAAATSASNAATSATNASTSASNAAASAASAQAIVDSVGFRDVLFKTFSDSPITVTQAMSGKLLSIDTSGGAVVINLAQISGLTLPFTLGVKKATGDGNTVTINRAGSDTFDDGSTSKVLSSVGGTTLIPDTDSAPDKWSTADFGAGVGQQLKQQFAAGVGFTAGVSTTVTLTETPLPSSKDALEVFFDAAYQQESEWSYSAGTGVITFNSVIPGGTLKIEAKWIAPLAIGTPADGTVTLAKMATLANQRLIGRNTAGTGTPEAVTLTQLLDWIGSAAQGDILYRGAASWSRLAASTSGLALLTQGAGANPAWGAPTGSLTAGTQAVRNPVATGVAATAHGLGQVPDFVVSYIECISTEHGCAVGDRIYGGTSNGTFGVNADATNLTLCCSGTPNIWDKTTGNAATITLAKWKLVAIPYKKN